MSERIINLEEFSIPALTGFLNSAVAPRPIALVSTMDKGGRANLSPFSYFNLFSIRPPILVFSPSRRARDGTLKHTHENILEAPEAVIHMVSSDIIHQVSLSSAEYEKGVNEFEKAGFTALKSEKVRPPRVAESQVAFECEIDRVIPLGEEGGAGHLVLCRILLAHVKESLLDEKGMLDPMKMDWVARLGGSLYCRLTPETLFSLPRPLAERGMGVDQLPRRIRCSVALTGNELAQLAGVGKLPNAREVIDFSARLDFSKIRSEEDLHRAAQDFLRKGLILEAWLTLLQEL